MKHKIFISPNGDIKAICNNRIEYVDDLGSKTIQRAADVEFNNAKGVWEIITPGGEIIGFDDRRPEAIQKEIKLVEERLRNELVTQA